MTERHVDLTELLEKLGIKFNLKIDKENMIIIISLDNLILFINAQPLP